uniref:RUS1 family protein C16orf58 homolog n=1 Tax=Sinocyclocheilus rhinocerous TaxID=307959 RepID=A0A673NH01_9TELE
MEDCEGVIATERYGSQESWKYLLKDGRMKRQKDALDGRLAGNSISGVFKSVFLPQGYPESVSEDYVQYQLWDTVQAFSSSLSGTLATQASLRGVGVGNQEATVAAATITWLLRDGTGIHSDWEDVLLFADILNDVAMFMEIAAPHFPPFFTLIVCIAGIFKSIVGVAGGATRAALTVHQARRNNMADISAKDGSQETLVNLAGLLVSLALIPLVTDNPLLTFILFFLFTVLHLFANYKAVRSVVMETLNEARLSIVLHQYLLHGQLLSPVEANQKEPVFLSLGRTVPIKLGVRLGDIVQEPGELQLALKNNSKPYLIGIKNGTVCVCLGSDASVRDEIMAACQALCLRAVLHDDSSPSGALKQLSNTKDPWDLVSQSHKMINQIIQTFLKELDQAKWQTDWTLLDWNEWRVEWSKKRS